MGNFALALYFSIYMLYLVQEVFALLSGCHIPKVEMVMDSNFIKAGNAGSQALYSAWLGSFGTFSASDDCGIFGGVKPTAVR